MVSYTKYTKQAPKVVPSAAVGVSVSPGSTEWANGSYVELTPGISLPIVACGFILNPNTAVVTEEFEIELGKGAATSEVVVGTTHGVGKGIAVQGAVNLIRFAIPIDVEANTRLAVRFRNTAANTTAWTAKLLYYEKAPEEAAKAQAIHDGLLVGV